MYAQRIFTALVTANSCNVPQITYHKTPIHHRGSSDQPGHPGFLFGPAIQASHVPPLSPLTLPGIYTITREGPSPIMHCVQAAAVQRALNRAHSIHIFSVEKVTPLTLETAGQQLGWDAINQSQRQEDDWYEGQNIGNCAK
jgi:hypothetical protein